MAGKTVKLHERTRPLLDEVTELLHRRGAERLPLSVHEEGADLQGGALTRMTQAVVIHMGLLSLRRYLTEVPSLDHDPLVDSERS